MPPTDRQQFRDGLIAGLPLVVGVLPFGLAFGAVAGEVGIGPLGVAVMGLVVFAGSSQFVAVGLLQAGVGFPQIWLATLVLNARHLLMSAVLSPRFAGRSAWLRAFAAHCLSDESFAVTDRARGGPWFMIGSHAAIGTAWVGGGVVGVFVGQALPPALAEAAGFSLVAFFVAIVAQTARDHARVATALVAGGVAHGLHGWLGAGWGLLLAALAGVLVGGALGPSRESSGET